MSTVGIVLANDEGEGFTGPKYGSLIHGTPMLRRTVEAALTWGLHDIIVVLGADAEATAEVIGDLSITTIIDPEWAEGSAAPLRAALDLVTRDKQITRSLIARGDQPGVTREVVSALLGRAEESEADAVVPKYRYARGWPVVIGTSMWQRMLGLEGEYDLQNLISMHAATIEEVWFDQLSPARYDSFDGLPEMGR